MPGIIRAVLLWGSVLALTGCMHPGWPSAGKNQDVVDLASQVSQEIGKDTKETFARIDAGLHPYVNKDTPALYVYVLDTNITTVAHPSPDKVGRNYRGFPDAAGKKYRDQIVAGALRDGAGWIDYLYAVPGAKNKHRKFTYYKLATGSDGAKYVVCCGAYRD